MTSFESKVSRVTIDSYNVLRGGKYRRIVVTLKLVSGEDMLEFREAGTRLRILLPVDKAFKHAVVRQAFIDRMDKAREKPKKVRRK